MLNIHGQTEIRQSSSRSWIICLTVGTGDKTIRSNKRSFNNSVPSLSVAFPVLPDFHHGPISVEDWWRSHDPVPSLLRPRHSRLHSVVPLHGHLLLLFHLATAYASERASVNAEQGGARCRFSRRDCGRSDVLRLWAVYLCLGAASGFCQAVWCDYVWNEYCLPIEPWPYCIKSFVSLSLCVPYC